MCHVVPSGKLMTLDLAREKANTRESESDLVNRGNGPMRLLGYYRNYSRKESTIKEADISTEILLDGMR